ncbi:MAG: serine/threonine protein kinase [Lachnospiraceae bacterium]|nr:serine/threonine protein kinase [Lachnospiraceae bacterium]
MLEIGSLVDGKYRVLNKCGEGGMSVVYMAINERANKTWAIKEVRKDGVKDFDLVKQGLIVETNLLKRLSHPNLPSIVDVIDSDDSFLIVMDFIEGRTLKDMLAEFGPQPQEDVIDWAKQLCGVMVYLHSRKPPIIYRDMKPSNVMLKPDGTIVLFDFGAAREYKLSSSGDTTCLGTRGYAAPEQYGGHGQTDARTDIFCLGATMYHLVTGHNPGSPPYQMYPIRQWNQNLSAGLESIITKCTQQNPDDRYASCAGLLYDLEHFGEADIAYRKKQIKRFRKFIVSAASAAAFCAASLSFYYLENSEKKSTYDYFISSAEKASGDERIAYYRNAISLEPENEEAWNALLKEFSEDDTFTSDESSMLQSILIAANGGQTNETSFKNKNREGYDKFCFEVGILYYYKLETGNGRMQAKHYFGVAMASEYLSEDQIVRAECLFRISEYYSIIGRVDNTGDSSVSYRDYWDDLVELTAGNLVEMDNPNTAIIMYREMTSQIISRADDFKNSGVTQSEMHEQLENIREHLETDFNSLTESQESGIQDSLKALNESLSQAEQVINSKFGRRSEEQQEEEV